MITPEIVASFASVYKTIDVFTMQGCFLFDIHYAFPRYDNDECVNFAHKFLELVRHKNYDLIFIQTK